MTVSIRIAGKLVHVSNIAARAAQIDASTGALLRHVRLDAAAIQSLRSMLVAEMGSVVQRMADALVIEEAAKRVASGRWTLSVVDSPQLRAIASTGDHGSGGSGGSGTGGGSGGSGGSGGGNNPLNDKAKTWIEVELLDKNKHPVSGLDVELTLPDGTIEKGKLSDKGSFRKDGIDPGTCRLRFPDLDGREWSKSSSFADGAAVKLFQGPPKIPAGAYKVVQGDHIASIAADAGFLSWKTIWDDAKNAALKNERNPNVLFPGDLLEIPTKQKREESIPTTEYSTFQTIGDPVQLRIVVLNWAGSPVVNTELNIHLGGDDRIMTGADGTATRRVLDPQGPREGTVSLNGYTLPLLVGHLDPVEQISGQVWRLNNLGYRAGTATSSADPLFLSAVEEFQCDNNLTVDGLCGPNTQAKLKEIHGC